MGPEDGRRMVICHLSCYDDWVTEWLDEAETEAWRGYLEMHARLFAHLDRQLQRQSDLSSADFQVLVQLSEAPEGRMRVFELAERLQWERSRLSHQLTRMEGRGLVCRQGCPSDRRGSFVELTPDGRRAIEAAAPGHVEAVRRHFVDVLDPEQLRTLADISRQVLASLP
jgi:DNA-binding MarR family transcriptional regulator